MHSDKLHTVANLLLEKEKVDGEEFAAIFTDQCLVFEINIEARIRPSF